MVVIASEVLPYLCQNDIFILKENWNMFSRKMFVDFLRKILSDIQGKIYWIFLEKKSKKFHMKAHLVAP